MLRLPIDSPTLGRIHPGRLHTMCNATRTRRRSPRRDVRRFHNKRRRASVSIVAWALQVMASPRTAAAHTKALLMTDSHTDLPHRHTMAPVISPSARRTRMYSPAICTEGPRQMDWRVRSLASEQVEKRRYCLHCGNGIMCISVSLQSSGGHQRYSRTLALRPCES